MTLHIVKEKDPNNQDNLENFYITHSMMAMPSVHLFLAGNKWDSVEVDVADSIPRCTLQYLLLQDNKLKVTSLPESITPHTVGLLSDLYPDKAGAIRGAYMMGKDIQEVLNN